MTVEARWPVPRGWAWTSIEDIADVTGGGTPSATDPLNFADDDGIPWITPADLTGYEDIYIARGRRNLSERGYKGSSAKLLPTGTVLFTSRAPIGYCAIAANPIATNQGFKSLTLFGDVSGELTRHYLKWSTPFLESLASGTTFLELSGGKLQQVPFPLPPLAEQNRIVAKLDALSAKSARARTELARIEVFISRYKQAVLSKAFRGELSNEQSTYSRKMLKVNDIISELIQGWSPKCQKQAATNDAQWAVITTTSIQPISFRYEENKVLPADLEPRPKLEIRKGDIIITRAGPRARCGVCCFVEETRPRLMLCDKAYCIRLRGSFDPKFFVYLVNSPECLTIIEKMKTGGNDSGLNLTQERFGSLLLPLWPIEVQHKCVQFIESAFSRIERLAAEAKRALDLLGKLDEAILAKAFRGELVPQDENDEPALVLLDRIRAERASAPKVKRRGRAATARS